MSAFSEKLANATNEDKQINPIYVNELKRGIPRVSGGKSRIDTDIIEYSHIKTDGVFRCYYINDETGMEHNYLLQLECKLDIDFTEPKERAKVLLQVVCYLRQIHDDVMEYNGTWETNALPKVIVLGSKINCLALPTSLLIEYAKGHIDGFKSASTAHLKPENQWLVEQIADNANIQTQAIIFDTADKDCITRLCEEIVKLGQGLKITEDLNEHTVSLAFDFFDMYVLDQKSSSKLSSREKVDLFIGTFFNEEFEETKTNRFASSPDKLKIHGTEVKINADKYNQFKILYNMREYSRLEQKQITAITDRLIEDTDRRRKGDFYTPSIWVDEAHKLLDKNLGANWREEYMVWDCAWGTGNLTRDYQFSDLYCSTIQDEDLNIGYRYNKGAVKFQYDFLNDDVMEMEQIKTFCKLGQFDTANAILFNTKLYKNAPGLIDGLLGINGKQKKKLLFLINPPYGTAKNGGTDAVSKKGIAMTKMNSVMIEDEIGACAQQLYAQFLYRIHCISKLFNGDCKIGIFAPPAYITGPTYKTFRKTLNDMAPIDGFILQGSQFADVKGTWGISFHLLGDKGSYEMVEDRILDYSSGELKELMKKRVYNLDNKDGTLSDWVKPKGKGADAPQMSNAISWKENGRGKLIPGALGYMMFNANNVEQSIQFVTYTSSCMAGANGVSIMPETYTKCMSGFSARSLMASESNWIIGHDEFMIPDIENKLYEQWESDCIVLSLFHSKSNPSSLRNIRYANKQWNIQNEFFWMSVKDIADLAGGKYDTADINTAIEDDIEDFGKERFVYKKLQEVTLSPDAKAVLDKASEIVKKSFKYRKDFNQKHADYHINTWDAGWYQIKGMCKEYPELKKELDAFNELYKQFEDRMRPLVYELGFLYK